MTTLTYKYCLQNSYQFLANEEFISSKYSAWITTYNLNRQKLVSRETIEECCRIPFNHSKVSNNGHGGINGHNNTSSTINETLPDFLVYGFEECVSIDLAWTRILPMIYDIPVTQSSTIHSLYSAIIGEVYGEMAIFIFLKKDSNFLLKSHNFKVLKIPCGLFNRLPNKGGIYVEIEHMNGQDNIGFVLCHFSCHSYEKRLLDLYRILHKIDNLTHKQPHLEKKTTFEKNREIRQSKSRIINGHIIPINKLFLLGDFNFRFNESIDRHESYQHVSNGKIIKILEQDDYFSIKLEFRSNWGFKGKLEKLKSFYEGPILFPPTYKYHNNSHVFDQSKKKRKPGYTDRIFCLLEKETDIDCILYDANFSVYGSDHYPVGGYFKW